MFVVYFFNKIYILSSIIFTGQCSCLCCRHIVHSFSCLIAACITRLFHKSDFHNLEQFSTAVNYTVSKVAVAPTRRLSLITENRSLLLETLDDWLLTVHTGADWGAAARCTIPWRVLRHHGNNWKCGADKNMKECISKLSTFLACTLRNVCQSCPRSKVFKVYHF